MIQFEKKPKPKYNFKPILLSPHMALAAWELRKTETRRCRKDSVTVKPKLEYLAGDYLWGRESLHWKDGKICYVSDGTPVDTSGAPAGYMANREFLPSMFMPKWAHRWTAHCTEARIERLQDINDDQAMSEGMIEDDLIVDVKNYGNGPVEIRGIRYAPFPEFKDEWFEGPTEAYKWLWNDLNEDRGLGWDENPWVAVYCFDPYKRRIEDWD